MCKYVVIFTKDLEVEVEGCFEHKIDAQEYIERKTKRRKDLFDICDDAYIFDNDETYLIRKVKNSLQKGK